MPGRSLWPQERSANAAPPATLAGLPGSESDARRRSDTPARSRAAQRSVPPEQARAETEDRARLGFLSFPALGLRTGGWGLSSRLLEQPVQLGLAHVEDRWSQGKKLCCLLPVLLRRCILNHVVCKHVVLRQRKTLVCRVSRARRRIVMLDGAFTDLRLAFRGMRNAPGFALAAALVLGAGPSNDLGGRRPRHSRSGHPRCRFDCPGGCDRRPGRRLGWIQNPGCLPVGGGCQGSHDFPHWRPSRPRCGPGGQLSSGPASDATGSGPGPQSRVTEGSYESLAFSERRTRLD